jgi:hypothetical protein
MAVPNEYKPGGAADALRDLRAAEAEVGQAERNLTKVREEVGDAETHLRKAEAEILELEAECHHEVEIKVDGCPRKVTAGTYTVSAFKALVGVAADRELDIVKHDTFTPLDDGAEITICEHEVFISHVRTGGSS